MNWDIAAMIRDRARRTPDAPAILAPGRRSLSYRGLARQIDLVRESLNGFGIGRGGRVATVLDNGPETAVAFLGIAGAATAAPLNPACTAAELEFYLSDLGAGALVVEAGRDTPARQAAERLDMPVIELTPRGEEPAGLFTLAGARSGTGTPPASGTEAGTALVLHTSGTTARPKIVPLTHRNLLASARNLAGWYALGPGDRTLAVMPFFHIHGLVASLLAPLVSGGATICLKGFDAEAFFASLEGLEPTWYSANPTIHHAVVSHSAAHAAAIGTSRLRFVRSSSSALGARLAAELERLFGAPVVDSYSMTEASHQMTANPLPPGRRKPGSVGLPAGVEVAIRDERGRVLPAGEPGEVVVRGPGVMAGYEANRAANSTAFVDGWLRTGDQGRLDADGYLTLTGRLKELINRGGEMIAPGEIEEVLLDLPGVEQAAAFSLPHPILGEEVGAAVVLREGSDIGESEIRAFAAAALAPFKVPRRVVFLDDIPKGATGKPQRAGLAEKLGLAEAVPQAPRGAAATERRPTPVEAAVLEIWRAALLRDRIGLDDDFIALGGNSLEAVRVILEVQEVFGVECSPDYMFGEASTVAGMAAEITRLRKEMSAEEAGSRPTEPRDGPRLVDRRMSDEGEITDRADLYYLDRDTGLRRAKPNVRFKGIEINSLGYRSPEIDAAKPGNVVRLAFLGSSNTFNPYASANATTWPHLTWLALQQALPGATLDYVNAALPGYNLSKLKTQFERFTAPLDPDAVIISPGEMHADTAYLAHEAGLYGRTHFRPGRLARSSSLGLKIEKNLTIAWRQLFAHAARGKLRFRPEELTRGFEARLERLVETCQARAGVVALVTLHQQLHREQSRLRQLRAAGSHVFYMPYMSIAGILDAFDAYNRAIRDVAARTGAILVDLENVVPRDRTHYADSTHCNDAGNRLVARHVSESLLAAPAFRALTEARGAARLGSFASLPAGERP